MVRKIALAVAAAAALATSASQSRAATLFTTQSDFTGFTGTPNVGVPTALFDTDGSTTNGLGNTAAPGGTGTAGGLLITIPTVGGSFNSTSSVGEQANAPFLAAISGATVSVDYTTTLTGGNYFQLLLLLNSSGTGFLTINPTVTTGATFSTATYTLPTISATQSYFQLGFIANTNNTGTVNVDNIRTPTTIPEPATLATLALGGLATLRRRRA